MKKYDINDFYVGKLTFLINSLSKQDNIRFDLMDTKRNGAISLRPGFTFEYIDWDKDLYYESVFTCFYKKNNKYYCLHNGMEYEMTNNDFAFCDQLKPLLSCLPVIGYNIPIELSFKEALKLFNILFKAPKKNIFNNEPLNMKKIYFGNLDLCSSYIESDENNKRLFYQNIPEDRILNSQKYLSEQYCYDIREIKDNKTIEYEYFRYKCLFYLLTNGEFYNLNNYQTYNLINYLNNNSKIKLNNTLYEVLDENKININSNEISIPKLLKLQEKIYRK